MTYTAWQASDLATVLACRQPTDYERAQAEQMLRDYAADLDRRAEGVTDAAIRIARVLIAARSVVAWDWSDNDADCVEDINRLRAAIDAATQEGEG